jgi:hypothetical protein
MRTKASTTYLHTSEKFHQTREAHTASIFLFKCKMPVLSLINPFEPPSDHVGKSLMSGG